MARKKIKATRSQQSILDKKHLGDEPTYSVGHALSRMELTYSYNWYNYMKSRDQGYKYLLDYFKDRDKNTFNKIKKTPDKNFSQTSFWIARLKSLGYVLSDKSEIFFAKSLEEAFNRTDNEDDNITSKKIEEKPKSAPVISIQQRMKDKRNDIVGLLEEILDVRDIEFSLYNYFLANDISKVYCSHIIDYYTPQLEEIELAISKKDLQINEAYNIYTKKELKEYKDILSNFISDAERYNQNKKTISKRKDAPISLEKKVKNFNFKNEDTELKIVSMNPAGIVGATEVWFYNSKYASVTVIRTSSINGLDIKGTSILNMDEEKSEVKKVGKKAEAIVQEILTAGKRSLKKVLDGVNTKANTPSPRTTKDMVILKIVK